MKYKKNDCLVTKPLIGTICIFLFIHKKLNEPDLFSDLCLYYNTDNLKKLKLKLSI